MKTWRTGKTAIEHEYRRKNPNGNYIWVRTYANLFKEPETGDIVAVISQLGIANDVESRVSGEIVEVLIEENQPVMFGQVLARIKE